MATEPDQIYGWDITYLPDHATSPMRTRGDLLLATEQNLQKI